jgi:hypothetical protein
MPLKVESEPSGATVYIMGEAIGETPITISQQRIYPAGYDADKQQQYGSLLIRKEGCRDSSRRIRYQDFYTGLSVKLDCNGHSAITTQKSITTPDIQKERATETRGTDLVPGSDIRTKAETPSTEVTAKQRLMRIDNLKRDGLISDEEYQEIRKRILDTL